MNGDQKRIKVSDIFPKTTTLFDWVYDAAVDDRFHTIVNQGGSSSGKTVCIMQVLCLLCMSDDPGDITTIAAKDMPALKEDAIRILDGLMIESPILAANIVKINKSDKIYEFRSGAFIEFNSYENAGVARHGKRKRLYMNEANNMTWEIFSELTLRTKEKTFIDYNPTNEFWAHEKIIGKPGVQTIYSNFMHNEYCPPIIAQKLMEYENTDEYRWRVMGLGMTGSLEGLVFPKTFHKAGPLPEGLKKRGYFLDYGYTNDVTALGEAGELGGELHMKQLIYETGLTNPQISQRLHKLKIDRRMPIIADSAEKKSNQELRDMGWNIIDAEKGPDSVSYSIGLLQNYNINIYESPDFWKERAKYQWKKEMSGKTTNTPIDAWNHLWDGARYWAMHFLKPQILRTGAGYSAHNYQ